MSIRKFVAVTLLLAGLAACTANNTDYGGGGVDPDRGGLHANSFGYGDRYYQLGRD
ncbi:MAG: hypothetical protein JO021_08170 [Alphaproteobacteria bacterium]|nr:hypothetical protein [Alphaproteobacteria bacterium]